jgi:toxin YoeB
MLLVWDNLNAWEDYIWWQAHDRKLLKRINLLIQTETKVWASPSR